MFRLRLLGSLDLARLDGAPILSVVAQPKRIALLAYLAAGRGRRHSREELIGVFWPESDGDDARNALRQTLHRLKRSLAEGVIIGRGDRDLEIDLELLECDVVDFEESIASGHLEKALELYRGDLVADLHVSGCPEFDHWRDQRAVSLRRSAVEAAATLSARMEGEGDLQAAIEFARRAVELAPSDESQVQTLMRVLASDGDRAGAVAAFEAFEARFRAELELEPSAQTMSLLHEIRSAETVVDLASATGPASDESREGVGRAPHEETRPRPVIPPGGSPAATVSTSSRRIGVVATAALVVTATVVGVMSWGGGVAAIHDELPRLVVLPFTNLSDAEHDYFADGMTEEITSRLSGFSGLRIIARQTAIQYEGSPLSAREIGEELGVDYVLEGTVRTDHAPGEIGQVRITPQLIRTSDEMHVWAEPHTAQLVAGDIFRIQAEMATRVAEGMDVILPASERESLVQMGTEDSDAYDFYLRGRYYFDRRRRLMEDYRAAADLFERAVAADRNYVEAYSMLARTYSFLASGLSFGQSEAGPKALAAAERASQLAPNGPAAHSAQADYQYFVAGRLDLAEQHLLAARRARPHDVSVLVRLGEVQNGLGKYDEANAALEEALELDPLSGLERLARNLSSLGRFAEAEVLFDRAIVFQPDSPRNHFFKTLLYLEWDGNTERAEAVVEAAAAQADLMNLMLVSWDFDDALVLRTFADQFDDAIQRRTLDAPADSVAYYFAKGQVARRTLRPIEADSYYDSARVVLEGRLENALYPLRTTRNLALAYAYLGNVEDARRMAAELPLQPIVPQIYMLIGDFDDAVHRLVELQNLDDRSLGTRLTSARVLRLDPLWDPLRDHPSFEALLAR